MNIKDKYLEIYLDGFASDVEYSKYFFANCFDINNAMMNSSQTSALHIRYKTLCYLDKAISFPFFVGVSTLNIRRGSGEIRELIKQALIRLKNEKMPFVGLYPFRHDYYTKYGFATIDKAIDFENSNDFCAVSQPLTFELIESWLDKYHQLYNDFCKEFNISLIKTKQDMAVKFKGMLMDKTEMIHYVSNGEIVGFRLYDNGVLEEIACNKDFAVKRLDKENAQCRIADIKSALELYKYSCDDRIIEFNVIDEMLGDSYWRVDIKNKIGTANEISAPIDGGITLTIGQLTVMLMHGENAEEYNLSRVFKNSTIFISDKY